MIIHFPSLQKNDTIGDLLTQDNDNRIHKSEFWFIGL